MRIYIVGVACVGKSTIGSVLAEKFGYKFIDFDWEVERQIGEHISAIKNKHYNEYGYREEVKHVLQNILDEYKDNVVIAMPPGGMFRQYLEILKKNPDVLTIALKDSAKNILKRLTFYDDDSKLIEEDIVTDDNREAYYEEVKDDIEYFYTTHRKTKMKFNLKGMGIEEGSEELFLKINEYFRDLEINK